MTHMYYYYSLLRSYSHVIVLFFSPFYFVSFFAARLYVPCTFFNVFVCMYNFLSFFNGTIPFNYLFKK